MLTILGPTPESAGATAVKEWCVNTVAVDPLGSAVLVNSEDGYLYRWDLRSNSFTQRIQLTGGIGEAYTPTAIGADGADTPRNMAYRVKLETGYLFLFQVYCYIVTRW